MTKISHKNVLITGGANGIGKLMGEKCLKKGASALVIWDINEENLHKAEEDFRRKGFENVHSYVVDVSDVSDIESAATRVLLDIGNIDILINNAGVVAGKPFVEHSARDIDKTLAINIGGVMHTTRVFLPEMIRQEFGHIVNIASASSLIPLPNGSVYASSKWAVLGWSESLRLEMEKDARNVHVTAICPSYINTGMFTGVKAPLLTPILEPEEIVNIIIKAIEKNKAVVYAPEIVNLVPFLKGILPTRATDLVGKILGIDKSMSEFKGRPEKEAMPEKKSQKKA